MSHLQQSLMYLKTKRVTPRVAKLIVDELDINFNDVFKVKELKEA
ncbi:hypothetical protein ACO2FP_05125 [Staphylococcus warneri]